MLPAIINVSFGNKTEGNMHINFDIPHHLCKFGCISMPSETDKNTYLEGKANSAFSLIIIVTT